MNGFDVVASAFDASARGTAFGPLLAFAAGAATSIGPCVASRTIAAVALSYRSRGDCWRGPLLMVLGTLTVEVAVGLGCGIAARSLAGDRLVYDLLALGFSIAGVVVLARKRESCATHRAQQAFGGGSAFLAGAGLGLAGSPCCTPLVASLGMLALTRGASSAAAALLLAAFSLGHALPTLCAPLALKAATRVRMARLHDVAPTVAGALLIASGAYYGLLA